MSTPEGQAGHGTEERTSQASQAPQAAPDLAGQTPHPPSTGQASAAGPADDVSAGAAAGPGEELSVGDAGRAAEEEPATSSDDAAEEPPD